MLCKNNQNVVPCRYYEKNQDVKEDTELQAFLNEVSANGVGPNGGLGKVLLLIVECLALRCIAHSQTAKIFFVINQMRDQSEDQSTVFQIVTEQK